MNSYWTNLSLYSGMISASVVAGGVIPLFLSWTRKQLHLLLAYSAGLMLGATVIHLIPSSLELIGEKAPYWILGGFLFLYIFQKIVTVHVCELFECEVHSMGISALIGLSAHALTDGIALGSGLMVSELGFVIFLTILFHKLPEAFALTTILMHEQAHSRKKIVFYNLALMAMVPIGAVAVKLLSSGQGSTLTGVALAFSAGTFLHISLSDLLPHVHEHAEKRMPIIIAFLVGLLGMVVLEVLLHHHGHSL